MNVSKLNFSDDVSEVINNADIIIMAMPSIHAEATLAGIDKEQLKNKKIVSAIKGVLPNHNILLHEYLQQQFQFPLAQYFTLLGPCHAEEVAAEKLSYLTFSGIDTEATQQIADYFTAEYINTRVNNDVNGNPRYVVHFLDILNNEENSFLPFSKKYDYALKKAKIIGGRKFHNKQFGGWIVFQSYNTDNLKEQIIDVMETTPKIKY